MNNQTRRGFLGMLTGIGAALVGRRALAESSAVAADDALPPTSAAPYDVVDGTSKINWDAVRPSGPRPWRTNYDGAPLFEAARHALPEGGTFSNVLSEDECIAQARRFKMALEKDMDRDLKAVLDDWHRAHRIATDWEVLDAGTLSSWPSYTNRYKP